ncbi:lysM and putative peptidoglycan-binding domain-containing protein 2 isoform 2-T2 [Mantella aurantiaca]
MAELSPVLQPHRDGGSRLGYTAFPGSEGESEAELSLSLARTKIRSYGSTASVTTPWAERYIEHRMEQIKRANKLFSTDCIFLRKSLNIPVISDKTSLFNGLNLLDSPETESQEDSNMQGEDSVSAPAKISSPSSSPETNRPIVTQDEELSAKDFLHRLDLQIKRSTQAAKRLKEEEYLRHEEEEYYSTSSYQH